jgi:hypothetical protein
MALHEAARRNVLNFVSTVGQKYAAGRLLALFSACFICTHARVDPDLWGHLRFGLDTVASGHLPITDPYSFTQDVPWINHEWLSEVTLALSYRAGGMARNAAAQGDRPRGRVSGARTPHHKHPSATTLVAAGGRHHRRRAGGAHDAAADVDAALHSAVVARAQSRWLLAIPLLFALWANLHGGWIVGLGIGGLWLVGRVIDERSFRASLLEAVAVAAGLAATLVNPYGWRLWWFLLTTVRPSRAIGEWRPAWEQSDATAALLWAAIVLVIVMPTMVRRRASIAWAGALPVMWLGVMGLFVVRLVPLFGEVALLGWRARGENL